MLYGGYYVVVNCTAIVVITSDVRDMDYVESVARSVCCYSFYVASIHDSLQQMVRILFCKRCGIPTCVFVYTRVQGRTGLDKCVRLCTTASGRSS